VGKPESPEINHDPKAPCIVHSMVRGSIGFGIVSLAAFSVWAFGEKWFQNHLGEPGLYAACAFVFIALSGLLLHPLLGRSGSLPGFYTIFIPAFFAYVVIWCTAWFVLRSGAGEWLGSLLGTAGFIGVISWRLKNARAFLQASLILFGLHSVGYFLGGQVMHWVLNAAGAGLLSGVSKPTLFVVAKLAWGLLYGLGFGAGIGYAFYAVQKKRRLESLNKGTIGPDWTNRPV
jgi:hypothetical protein